MKLPDIPPSAEHGAPARIQLRLSGLGDEKHCLLMGNSLTHFNYMPQMLEKLLCASTGETWVCSSITRGGATLRWHRQMRYVDKVLETSPTPFDVVVIQDQSRRPAADADASAEDFSYWIEKAENSGAQALLYQTWNLCGQPPLIETFMDTLRRAANGTHAVIAPVGDAWDVLLETLPESSLYREDGKHPKALGSLIAAVILCYKICGSIPETCPDGMLAGGYEELSLPDGFWEKLRSFTQALAT